MKLIITALGTYLTALLLAGCNTDEPVSTVQQAPLADTPRPNILLVVVDDMGFSDIGAFGGEIPTPNLDQLAQRGTRFTDFQVLPACSPTRATLLTGREPHDVGFGSLAEELADNRKGAAAYAGALPVDVTTLPRLLQFAGYRTYMAGKWHLGFEAGRGPAFFGFDESVAMLDGGASHFVDMQPAYAPDPTAVARYTRNDELLRQLPEDFVYSSQFYADRLIGFIGEQPSQPFFGYLSFTAPHWPLQAPDETIAQFEAQYQDGYDVLRQQRLENLVALGLVPEGTPQSTPPPKVRPWASLSPGERAREARAMAVYAAMVAQIDEQVGKVMAHLQAIGELDHTVVLFLSDNGAEGHDLDETWPGDLFPKIRAVIDERFDHSTEQMGRPGSYTLYGAGWAHASAPHLRLYKGFPTEGGTRVAAFLTLPDTFAQLPEGHIVNVRTSVRDVMPTLLALARAPVPSTVSLSFTGRSLLPLLRAEQGEVAQLPVAIEFLGKVAVRSGHWKLVKLPVPYGVGEYSLHDLRSDLGESIDVSAQYPAVVAQLQAVYEQYRARYGVIEPDWVSGY